MPAVAMLHDVDPREDLLRRAGDLESVEIFGNDILVAIYKRPEKTKSGIILVDDTRGEDVHQGKVGLILKMGPVAYIDKDGVRFRDIKEGDWIVFRPSDGWGLTVNGVMCRLLDDRVIRGRHAIPDAIY